MSRLRTSLVVAIVLLMCLPGPLSLVHLNGEQPAQYSQQVEISSNDTSTPIKHVINIFLENHSFDNLFGIYPALTKNGTLSIPDNLSVPDNLVGHNSILSKLTAVSDGQFATANPVEGWVPYHQDWNNGAMNGFLNGSGKQSMTYYSAAQMAPEWSLAMQYGLADNFYADQIGESTPNHLFYLTGFSPVHNDYGHPPYIPFSQTIMGELQNYNISWNIYTQHSDPLISDWNFFTGTGAYNSHLKGWSDFSSDVHNGTLPAASWLFSQGSGTYAQGPPGEILSGELWLLHVVDMVEASSIWNSTAVFITYDEFGGFYDQVSPPVFHGVQLGVRIPLLVISPYAKENYVSNSLLSLTSLLAFIDYNWNIPSLNTFVSESMLPLDFFDFSEVRLGTAQVRAPLSFSSLYGFPVPTTMYFTLTQTMTQFNYSTHFPGILQIPIKDLNYTRNGSYSGNLSNGIYVKQNYVSTPFYDTPYFMIALVLAQLAIAAAVIYRKRGWKNE